jgi:hypothetical protein
MPLPFLLLLLLLAVSACKTPDPKPVELGETKNGMKPFVAKIPRMELGKVITQGPWVGDN